jgi:NADPH:quinone reductase-like Zn-dependent oxidoreductase
MAVVPARRLAVVPEDVSFGVAATLPIAGTTAIRILDLGGTLVGHRVLITGAAGGVGTMAVQLASIGGSEVTAVVGSPDRAQGITELGASKTVFEAADAESPFRLILESVGGASFESALEKVAAHGLIVSYGNSSDTPARYQFETMYHANGAKVEFFFNYQTTDENLAETLRRLVNLVARLQLKPAIGFSEEWDRTPDALARLRARQIFGKAVLHIPSP